MSKYVKTVYTTALEAANLLGLSYIAKQGTTLKDKFNLDVVEVSGVNPELKYYMLGDDYSSLVIDDAIELDLANH